MEFHIYKPKQERSFRVLLKHIHATTNLDDVKKEIVNLEHTVTNIWNIKRQDTKKTLPVFYVELKPESNNKDACEI
ncbi:hypothetical protein HN011_006986, partial [Eciton burchellii]